MNLLQRVWDLIDPPAAIVAQRIRDRIRRENLRRVTAATNGIHPCGELASDELLRLRGHRIQGAD